MNHIDKGLTSLLYLLKKAILTNDCFRRPARQDGRGTAIFIFIRTFHLFTITWADAGLEGPDKVIKNKQYAGPVYTAHSQSRCVSSGLGPIRN